MTARAQPEPLEVAAIADDEYRRRRDKARQLVAQGKLAPARAEAEMRAWAAIALMAGGDALQTELEDYHRSMTYFIVNGKPAPADYRMPEAEARCELARDLCGPNTWGPILGAARDAALARADTPERRKRAVGLNFLAHALDVPLTLASCGMAATERNAA